LRFSFSDLGGLEHELGDAGEESALAEVDLFEGDRGEELRENLDLLVTQNLSQAVERPTLSYLARSVRRRAATSKRRTRKNRRSRDIGDEFAAIGRAWTELVRKRKHYGFS
jgi:hypothetical protein